MGFLSRIFGRREQGRPQLHFVRELIEHPDCWILHLQGDLTETIGAGINELYRHVDEQGGAGQRDLIVDLAEATECNFSTLSYVVHALRRRVDTGKRVLLANVPQDLKSDIEIARLENLIPMYDSVEAAEQALLDGNSGAAPASDGQSADGQRAEG